MLHLSESCVIPAGIVKDLYDRFARIYILYDFDRTGVSFANRHRKLYGFIPLFFTNGKFNTFDYKSKDLSDFIANNGLRDAAELIEYVCQEEYLYQGTSQSSKNGRRWTGRYFIVSKDGKILQK